MGIGTPSPSRARFSKATGALAASGIAAALLALSTTTTGCVGIPSGIEYPDVSDVDLDKAVLTPEGDPDPSIKLSEFKINPKVCEGLDMHVPTQPLDQEDLTRFFGSEKVNLTPKKARSDLWWYEFPVSNDPADGSLRLRVAVLRDRNAAAKDLHDSLLEHGPGWWGLRRGNLAVLAPKASLKDALRFAVKYKLVCWGQFTYAGADDVFSTVGGYSEF
jgi:hypothetical protein